MNLNYSHGQTGTAEHAAWLQIRNRCHNPKSKAFKNYGGRGIQVSYESFEDFLADVGRRPSGRMTIERIDNNGHYQTGNCRWATFTEQANNRRGNRHYFLEGVRFTLSELCRMIGICYGMVIQRLKRGWSITEALETDMEVTPA